MIIAERIAVRLARSSLIRSLFSAAILSKSGLEQEREPIDISHFLYGTISFQVSLLTHSPIPTSRLRV